MNNANNISLGRWQKSVVRGLQQGITPTEELASLRRVNPALAELAERQNEKCRAAIAKATGSAS